MGLQRLGGAAVAGLLAGDSDLLLMDSFQGVSDGLTELCLLLLALLELHLHRIQLGLAAGEDLGQLLQLALAAEEIRYLRLHRAAGHGAAGVHHIALQGDQAEAVAAGAHDLDAMIQVIRDDGTAQQIFNDIAVLGRTAHQLAGNADAARHLQHVADIAVQR